MTDFVSHVFCFNDTAPTEIYTLSLHDALPISAGFLENDLLGEGHDADGSGLGVDEQVVDALELVVQLLDLDDLLVDRKSTRLNSSHRTISYAVFCLKKKKRAG